MSIRITGMNSGMDTDAMVKELVNAYEKQGQKYSKAKTKTEWKQEAWTSLNTKIKSFFSKSVTNMRFSSAYSKKTTAVSDSSKASVITADNAINGTQNLKITQLATSGYLTGEKISGSGVTGSTKLSDLGYEGGKQTITISKGQLVDGEYQGTKTFDIDEDTTINQFVDLVKNAGFSANFDSGNGRIYISSKDSGAANDFTFTGGKGVTDLLGLTTTGAKKIPGTDAQIELNGVEYTSNSNTFNINGLTITAKDVTTGTNGVSISTSTDYEDIYNTIKDFLKEYNSLVNEIDKLYNAKSSKGYEPLTAEEKEAMTDDEIEKWETKIKDSLLKGDGDLDKIGSAMRSSMLKTYTVGDKTLSLSSFGINTLGYFESAENEKNALHIAGDSDDGSTSGLTNKLKAMIASDPEGTASFFQKLVGGLYTEMNKIQSASDNYTSYGNFYSDKKISSDLKSNEKQVTKWEDYVAKIEEKYYKQFTAMEKAMGKLQEQQNSLSQLFGA